MVTMARNRFCNILLIGAILGATGHLMAQEPATEMPPTAVQPADAQAAIQPAADADLAAEVQQLRTQVDQLQSQVARLSSMVEELQASRSGLEKPSVSSRSSKKSPTTAESSAPKKNTVSIAPTPAAAAEVPEAPLTVLVFQDGHRTEARNYAIIGQTLWIYTDQDSKKVPLAELDVNATKSANSDRGIVFQVPPTK
jgi:TolA-binding protein